MPSLPAKDPDAVLDYSYTIPLDDGDSVASATFESLSGTVVIDEQSRAGADLSFTLSGGEDGETSVFRVAWTTAGGRTNDDVLTLAVASHEPEALVLSGFAKPSAAHLIARYPAFADVDVSTIRAWLTDAERYVDTTWSEGDYAPAIMALAAHNLALEGFGTEAAALAGVPVGVTSLKSGSFSMTMTSEAANARSSGGYKATRYGLEYYALLRRNKGGPRVAASGVLPYDPYTRYPQGQE